MTRRARGVAVVIAVVLLAGIASTIVHDAPSAAAQEH
jgi:hypothetical protein